jgi:hypothetical protein
MLMPAYQWSHHSRTGSSSCIRNGQNSPPPNWQISPLGGGSYLQYFMEFNISWHPKIPDQNLICILLVPRESFVAGPRSYEFANDNTFRAEEVTHFSSVGRTLNYWQRGWNYLVSPWNFSFLKILPYKKISSWPCRSKCVIMAWSWCDHGVFTPTNCMISFSNTVIYFKNTQAFFISYVLLVACPHGKVVGRGWFR